MLTGASPLDTDTVDVFLEAAATMPSRLAAVPPTEKDMVLPDKVVATLDVLEGATAMCSAMRERTRVLLDANCV